MNDAARTARGPRLTQYAHGGGCACKIPPGELEEMLRLADQTADHAIAGPAEVTVTAANGGHEAGELLVGLDGGDDAAAVRLDAGGSVALLSTTDFFTPVVDDAYDWGRIAAANAFSDIYAMGGHPVLAVNLLGWPREQLGSEIASQVLRGGMDMAQTARCHLAGGHSVDDPEPKYGLAVTGVGDPSTLLRNDAGVAGLPLSLTKPLGVGVLNNRHKATGEVFEHAVEMMTTLNREASEAAVAAGVRCATDVTGFGLLGHLFKMVRASGLGAVLDAAAVPYLDGARDALADGYVSGGTRRNLDWVAGHVDVSGVDSDEALLLADAQTSGGLLLAGEVPGGTIVGQLVPAGEYAITVR